MTTLFRFQILIALMASLSLVAVGCGDDSDDDDDMAGDDDDDMAGDDDDDAVCQDVSCGTETCGSVDVSVLEVCGCCAQAESNSCGSDLSMGDPIPISMAVPELDGTAGCVAFEQPGNLDESCPPTSFTIPGDTEPTMIPGCCRASGECGFFGDFSVIAEGAPNFGCVSYDVFTNESDPAACTPAE